MSTSPSKPTLSLVNTISGITTLSLEEILEACETEHLTPTDAAHAERLKTLCGGDKELLTAAARWIAQQAREADPDAVAEASAPQMLRRQLKVHIPIARGDGKLHEYTASELHTLMERCGIPDGQLASRICLYDAGGSYYYATMDGYKPLGQLQGGRLHTIEHALAAFSEDVVNFFSETEKETKEGPVTVYKRLSLDRLLSSCASRVASVRLEYDIDFGHYDADTDSLILAAGKRATIYPIFDSAADAWLRAFAGERYTQLQSWLVLAVAKPMPGYLPALMMLGTARAGKDSLRKAVAKFWRDGGEGTAFETAVDPNNTNGVERSPVIVIEEELKVASFNRADPFAAFKTAVVADEHRTNSKYVRVGCIKGHWRIFGTFNDLESVLRGTGKGAANIAAATNRMLYMPIQASPALDEARKALGLTDEDLPPDVAANHFDSIYLRIAGHIAWLASKAEATHLVRNQLMNFVKSDDLPKQKLKGDSSVAQDAMDVLYRSLFGEHSSESTRAPQFAEEEPSVPIQTGYIVLKEGESFVVGLQSGEFSDQLKLSLKWATRQAKTAIELISDAPNRVRVDGQRLRFRALNMALFYDFCVESRGLTKEEVDKQLAACCRA